MAELVSQSATSYAASAPAADNPSHAAPVVLWREVLAVLLVVALADLTIYRGAGFAGIAAFLVGSPVLLLIGSPQRAFRGSFWVVSVMLVLLTARMIWLGSSLAVVAGATLLIAYSLVIQGRRPYVFDVLARTAQLAVAGGFGLAKYGQILKGYKPRFPQLFWLNLFLPIGAVVVFGTLFILANPDVVKLVADGADRFTRWLLDWSEGIAEHWLEFLFWIATAYVAVGLLRPILNRQVASDESLPVPSQAGPLPLNSPVYYALRNTLLAVIGLFAIYLVFEFKTLWFRTFPPGFYYAGYAHEGAAWLTVALALATLALSLIFRGQILRDPMLPSLRKLAWIWSAENVLLALTVYNRMYIYVDFNGMTRMRTIGLFGISTVVVGFALVLWKIIRHRDFIWLVNRQLWALAIAIYLFALTPVDFLVHQYNVRQILAGDLAPAVQISVHPISSEGLLVLSPLIRCEDPIISDGVRALLAQREMEIEQRTKEQSALGWAAFQLADRLLLGQLRAKHKEWADFSDEPKRQAALERFHEYAYQWY